ncbi:MAG: SiaB family protein kinase [Parvicellaceae bacterium]
MINYLNIIYHIKDNFRGDILSIYYKGKHSDSFSEFIISLADHESNKEIKKKLSFLMIEVFQNIVRHSEEDQEEKNDCFGIRNTEEAVHIFSSNKITQTAYNFLNNKLAEINSLDQNQLKEIYRDVLKNGVLNEKGGAGLGLIEMARKSNNPIQKKFEKINTNTYQFNYQVDISTQKNTSLKQAQKIAIDENIDLHCDFSKSNVLFFFNGNFSKENIQSLLTILTANIPKYSRKKNVNYFRIFHTGVELIQNISRHGKKVNDILDGTFCIFKTKNGFYIGTGNLIKSGDYAELEEFLTKINSYNVSDLTTQYLKALKENAFVENNNAGVGLIDVRRYNHSKIDFEINNIDNGIYLNLGVYIPKYI